MTGPGPLDTLRALAPWMRAERALLLRATAALVLVSGAALAVPALVHALVDTLAGTRRIAPSLVPLLAGAFMLAALAGYHSSVALSLAGFRLRDRARTAIFRMLLDQPLPVHAAHRTGEVSTRLLDDVGRLQPVYAALLAPFIQHGLTAAGCLIQLMRIDAPAALVLLLIFAAPIPLVATAGRRVFRAFGDATDAHARAGAVFTEALLGLRDLRAFGGTSSRHRSFTAAQSEALGHETRAARLQAGMQHVMGVLLSAVLVGLFHLAAGGMSIGDGPGAVVAFYLYAWVLAASAVASSRAVLQWNGIAGAVRRLVDTVGLDAWTAAARMSLPVQTGEEPSVSDRADTDTEPSPRGTVTVRNLRFAWPDRPALFEDFDLDIAAGEWVLLSAPSGRGKSTLALLLLGVLTPGAGTVRIDGMDAHTLPVDVPQRVVTGVAQDPVLFHGTLRDNVLLGLDERSVDFVTREPASHYRTALDIACVDDVIASLPEGELTVIGERGHTLSGGQRARVALARALVRDPDVLILDEAHAALQEDLERRMWSRLLDARRDRTTIILGHHAEHLPRIDRRITLPPGDATPAA